QYSARRLHTSLPQSTMLTVNKSKTPKSQCPFLRGVNLHSLPQRRVEHTRDLIGFRGAIRWGRGTSVPPPTVHRRARQTTLAPPVSKQRIPRPNESFPVSHPP